MPVTMSVCPGGNHITITETNDKGVVVNSVTVNKDDLFNVPHVDAKEALVADVKEVIKDTDAKTFEEAKDAVEAEFAMIEVKP